MLLGCDPGHSGAIALMDDGGRLIDVWDMPTFTEAKSGGVRTRVDGIAVRAILRTTIERYGRLAAVVIEQVGPSTSASGSFIFGRGLGVLEGVIAGFPSLPTRYAAPLKWKRHFGLGSDKDASVRKAGELFPAFSHRFVGPRGGLLDGRAEAALIARFYVDTL